MKRILFTILWMLGAFLVGCVLFVVFLMVVGVILEAQGDPLSTPNKKRPVLFLINMLMVYGPPAIALILGILGILPGTRRTRARYSGPAFASTSPPPISQHSSPRSPPPVVAQPQTGAIMLSRDQVATFLQRMVQEKFSKDLQLLGAELLEALLRCVTDKKTFNLVAAQSGQPSEQEIGAFEQTIGFPLPQDYRAFAMSGFSCLFLEVKANVWPRPKEGAIVPAWHLNHAVYVYGLSADVPDYMDIRKQFAGFSKGGRRIVPFLRLEGFLDHYCFTPEGRIVLWRSETRDVEPVDITFSALLRKEIRALQERAERIQKEPNPYAEFQS